MMTYADGYHSHSVIGIALVVGSASLSALYKVTTLRLFQAVGASFMCLHSLLLSRCCQVLDCCVGSRHQPFRLVPTSYHSVQE